MEKEMTDNLYAPPALNWFQLGTMTWKGSTVTHSDSSLVNEQHIYKGSFLSNGMETDEEGFEVEDVKHPVIQLKATERNIPQGKYETYIKLARGVPTGYSKERGWYYGDTPLDRGAAEQVFGKPLVEAVEKDGSS